jgi:hypothetical protein
MTKKMTDEKKKTDEDSDNVQINVSLKEIYGLLCPECKNKLLDYIWEKVPEEKKNTSFVKHPLLKKVWEKLSDREKAQVLFGLE